MTCVNYNYPTEIVQIVLRWTFQCKNLSSYALYVIFLNVLIMRRCDLTVDIWCYVERLMPKLIGKTDNDRIEP